MSKRAVHTDTVGKQHRFQNHVMYLRHDKTSTISLFSTHVTYLRHYL